MFSSHVSTELPTSTSPLVLLNFSAPNDAFGTTHTVVGGWGRHLWVPQVWKLSLSVLLEG